MRCQWIRKTTPLVNPTRIGIPVVIICRSSPNTTRDDSKLSKCQNTVTRDQRQRGGLSVQVEQQRRPLVEARGAPASVRRSPVWTAAGEWRGGVDGVDAANARGGS